jgi:hypothetical protein
MFSICSMIQRAKVLNKDKPHAPDNAEFNK